MSNRTDASHTTGKIDILQGTLDLMVLHTLATLGAQHGYAVASRLEQIAGGVFQVNMGTLYPALVRLEQRGFLRSKWGMTENSRRARYYEITAAGLRHMDTARTNWLQITAIMSKLLAGEV